VYTRGEIETLIPDRLKKSENALTLSVEINNIKFAQTPNADDPHIISLDITFQNISDHSIVFKKPRSTGFTGQGLGGFPMVFNDVGIVVRRKDGTPMNMGATTQFTERPPARDALAIFFFHLPDDFITLESGETFSYTFTEDLPAVFFEGETSATKLPPGSYTLFAGYGNETIGYQMTPVKADSFLDPNSQIADLNAWVGSLISSNEVDFTIPN
jgi:hypothetical protein